jgi:flagellar assembly protein FliH
MNNTSSRILRPDELGAVTNVWWREATAPLPHAASANNSSVTAVAAEGPGLAGEPGPQTEHATMEAYQRGFTEGRGVGHQQAMGEAQPVIDRMTRSLAELSSLRGRIRKEAEADLVKLAIAVARRVLHRELTLDSESISGIIRVALEKLESRDMCRVRVHPDQASTVRTALGRFGDGQNMELVADPSLQNGDVLFETPQGTLDASIEVQLAEIERGFADRLKR